MEHRPYKHCKRCARKLFGLTNKYSCYIHMLPMKFKKLSVNGKWTKLPEPNKKCMNFCKKIKPMCGMITNNIEFEGVSDEHRYHPSG